MTSNTYYLNSSVLKVENCVYLEVMIERLIVTVCIGLQAIAWALNKQWLRVTRHACFCHTNSFTGIQDCVAVYLYIYIYIYVLEYYHIKSNEKFI